MLFIARSLIMVCIASCTCNAASSQIDKVCSSESYITVEELYKNCHVPGTCGKHLEHEGQTALVKGAIDYNNVFEKSLYPQLPYEKFFLVGDKGKILDVVAVSSDNASIFLKIFAARKEGKKNVFITGTIRGFDASIMGACNREMTLEINSHKDVSFK